MQRIIALIILLFVFVGSAAAGFTPGTYGDNTSAGWSTFTAQTVTTGACSTKNANGTCALYVDKTCLPASCNCSLTTVGDLTHLCGHIRDAFAAYSGRTVFFGDWILIRKGQTYNDGDIFSADGVTCCFNMSGNDASNYLVLSNYDPSQPSVVNPATGVARPELQQANDNQVYMACQGNSGCHFVAVVGLYFHNTFCDPNITGVVAHTPCANAAIFVTATNTNPDMVIEDVKASWFNQGFAPQGLAINDNYRVRRNQFVNNAADNIEGGTGGSNTWILQENVLHGGANNQARYLGMTVTNANPGVFSVANGMRIDGTGQVFFDTANGSLSAVPTFYNVVDNNLTTFRIVAAANANSQTSNTNSSTRITAYNVSGLTVGDGVNCSTCGSTTASPVTISSIPSGFNITGNTHTTTTIDGIASTTGIFVGSNVSSSDAACASSQPTIAAGTVVTAVAVNSITISPAACATVTGLTPIAVVPNTFVMSASASDTAQHTVTTFHQTSLITGVGATSPQPVTYVAFLDLVSRLHNLYASELETDSGIFFGKLDVRGNLVTYEPGGGTQFRPGGNISNNAFVNENVVGYYMSFVNQTTTVNNNVILSPIEWNAAQFSGSIPLESYTSAYNARPTMLGSFVFNNNVVANGAASLNPNGFSTHDLNNGFTVSYDNNVTFNWNSASQFDQHGGGGGIQAAHITAGGSGLTDKSVDIDTGTAIGTNGKGLIQITTVQDIGAIFGFDIYQSFYITGLAGAACPLNNTLFYAQVNNPLSSHQVNLYPPATLGTCTVTGAVGPKIYYADPAVIPNLVCSGVSSSGCTNGAAATGATTQVISVGGAAVGLVLFGAEGLNPQSGIKYSVNDTLHLSVGTGNSINVDQVSVLTDGGHNKFNPSSSNTTFHFPGCSAPSASTDPTTCTAAHYYDFVVGSAGHTDLDFITAAINNDKSNWNPALTANNGLVPWIQAGFGLGNGVTNGVRGLGLGKTLWLFRRDLNPANDNDYTPVFLDRAA